MDRTTRKTTRKKKKNSKKTPATLIVLLIAAAVAAIAIGAVLLSGNSYSDVRLEPEQCFCIAGENEAAILMNGSLSEEKAFYENGKIYLPYELTAELPGNAFYYDTKLQTLYLTLQNENNIWTAADPDILRVSGDDAYINAETVQRYSDADIVLYSDPARVTIRTKWTDIVTVQAVEDTQMRMDPNRKGSITEDVPAGTTLIYLDAEEKGWSLCAADNGYFGYIETEKLIFDEPKNLPHETNPLTAFEAISMNEMIKMVWHYVDVQENNDILDYMLEDTGDINVICPTWITIRNNQGDVDSLADEAYVANIRKRGMKIWTMVSDYLGTDASTGSILMERDSRIRLEEQILKVVTDYGLDGINIDFETITEEQAPAYLQFLRELGVETHRLGVILSTDNYVPKYTGHYDRFAQAKIVDYLIIMGYDEHTEYSAEPGPVASLPFVKEGIEKTLAEVPAEKVILGVPFYTRSWTQPFGTDYFETDALSMPRAEEFIKEKNITLAWDEELGLYYGKASDDSAVYSIWMEEAGSLGEKLSLVSEYHLHGASAWRLGLENPDIWSIWNSVW